MLSCHTTSQQQQYKYPAVRRLKPASHVSTRLHCSKQTLMAVVTQFANPQTKWALKQTVEPQWTMDRM